VTDSVDVVVESDDVVGTGGFLALRRAIGLCRLRDALAC
jgi:hypothetical protein